MKFSARTSQMLGFEDRELNAISNHELNESSRRFGGHTFNATMLSVVSGVGIGIGGMLTAGAVLAGASTAAITLPLLAAGVGVGAMIRSRQVINNISKAQDDLGAEMDRRDGISQFTPLNRKTLGTDDSNINQASRIDILRHERKLDGSVRGCFAMAGAGALAFGGGIAAAITGAMSGNPLLVGPGAGLIVAGSNLIRVGLGASEEAKEEHSALRTELTRRTNTGPLGMA